MTAIDTAVENLFDFVFFRSIVKKNRGRTRRDRVVRIEVLRRVVALKLRDMENIMDV